MDALKTDLVNNGFSQDLIDSLTNNDILNLFRFVDTNCDGKITWDELCDAMTKVLDTYVPPNVIELIQATRELLDTKTKADLLCYYISD